MSATIADPAFLDHSEHRRANQIAHSPLFIILIYFVNLFAFWPEPAIGSQMASLH